VNAYTITSLAHDAGISVNIVRDYVLRGLVSPAVRTESGYGIFDGPALQRLRFVRAAFEAGIALDVLVRLCRALDAGDAALVSEQTDAMRRALAQRRHALLEVEAQLRVLAPDRREAGAHLEASP